MDRILGLFLLPLHRSGKLRRLYNLKLTHNFAYLVLCHRCKEISICGDPTQPVESEVISAIFQAIKRGTYEIVIEILKANPDLIWGNEKLSRDLLFWVIKYHEGRLLSFVTRIYAGKKALLSFRDNDGNNALHLAAKLPDRHYEPVGINAAWIMTHEEGWFEKMKSYLPCWYHEEENRYGETPDQVFYREHQELITNMEEWGKKTAESYSLASVLIVTIMFAALFTVPGGIDEKTGMPKLLHLKQLSGFLISDAVSFITASTSFVGFLSVLTLTYKRRGRRRTLPLRLLFAILSLIISIATMILTFIFALAIMLGNTCHVLPAIIIYVVVVLGVMFSDWQLPTLLNLFSMMALRLRSY
ncbi:hypothetical protein SLEP1_g42683 [Rubroshorea leprosula]|uniref:PGG domain-containing protein n=1 Tax=Rubroshorea leprosula TaxID=152421 RepID=A0AAV5LAN9_9ROSI|nr:hypothetical protein SLEP1_g42683 [Rubroshorea leprosula]